MLWCEVQINQVTSTSSARVTEIPETVTEKYLQYCKCPNSLPQFQNPISNGRRVAHLEKVSGEKMRSVNNSSYRIQHEQVLSK